MSTVVHIPIHKRKDSLQMNHLNAEDYVVIKTMEIFTIVILRKMKLLLTAKALDYLCL